MKIKNHTVDLIALSSSLVCSVHCAAIPLLLSFTSFSSLYFLKHNYIEWAFIACGLVFVLVSLWPSYKNVHHKAKPLLCAAFGFSFMALGRLHLTELWEVSHTVIGGGLVALAHYFNWKLLNVKRKSQSVLPN